MAQNFGHDSGLGGPTWCLAQNFILCLVLGKFEGKCEGKKIKRKSERKEKNERK